MKKNALWNRDETQAPRGPVKPLMSALLLAAVLGSAGAMSAPERVSEPARDDRGEVMSAPGHASGPEAVAARDAGGPRTGAQPCSGEDAPHDRFLHWAIAQHRLAVKGAVP